jgi:transglutaminase-like putative cysteine protease
MNHGVLDQIPRSSLVLLFVAQAAVIAPQVPRLSPWILGVWLVCVVWRVLVYQGRWGYPGTITKAGLILLAAVGVGVGHGQLYGLDPASALLVVAFSLKLLEMHDRRDALVVIYLAYFVLAVEFLYGQSMALTAYQLGAALLVTASLVGLHQSWSRPRTRESLRTAAVLMLQAVPLTIVMFVFFPRVAPLWSVPLPDAASRTGISDEMTPGDISSLGNSDELAFRAEFEGEAPSNPGLYWRALTLSEYDPAAGTWSTGSPPRLESGDTLVWYPGMRRTPGWIERLDLEGPSLRYTVVMEPTYRRWLFGIDVAVPRTDRIGVGADFRLFVQEPVASRMRYEVTSYPRAELDPVLDPAMRTRETALPSAGNPRTRELLEELEAGTASVPELIQRILGHFRTEAFYYTLQPPTLTGDRIDRFLFDTRRGFCGHYAGAFVYMMRLAGVPARVVAGYQGGEPNPLGNYLIVRQYDAHAWAEVWLEGQGWRRVDPTAAVAPERIERGADADFREAVGGEGGLAAEDLGGMAWALDLLYWVDSLEYRWNIFVLSYDATLQSRFLRDLLGEVTPTRVAIAVTVAGALAMALSALGFFLGVVRGRRDPLHRAHDRFAAAFARAGTPRAPHETPRAYADRLAAAHPELADEVRSIAADLDAALWDPRGDRALPEDLDRRLRRLSARLVLRRLRRTFGGTDARGA